MNDLEAFVKIKRDMGVKDRYDIIREVCEI